MRHRNGVKKRCRCGPRAWPKCAHEWQLDYKPRGGVRYRFSLDAELGRHIDSKTEAEKLATDIRAAINAGTFERAAERRAREQREAAERLQHAPAAADLVTLETFAAIYVERVSQVRNRNKDWKADRYAFAQVAAFTLTDGSRLGDKPLGAITEDDLEAVLTDLRTKGRAASTRNHYVQLLKASCRWAVRKGYLTHSPISEASDLKRTKIAKRNRRLAPDRFDDEGRLVYAGEERTLLAVAGPRLQNLIIGALETCARRGELLNLRWCDVNLAGRKLTIRAETAKDDESRTIPISARLASVLEMARVNPANKEYPVDAYPFGELGQKVTTVTRAWETAVLKAHGHEPAWDRPGVLSAASRAALEAIDLHFHDLRHEGASRLLERGWPLHHVQYMLGHASIEQTSTYLNVEAHGLQETMQRFDTSALENPWHTHGTQGVSTAVERSADDASVSRKALVN